MSAAIHVQKDEVIAYQCIAQSHKGTWGRYDTNSGLAGGVLKQLPGELARRFIRVLFVSLKPSVSGEPNPHHRPS